MVQRVHLSRPESFERANVCCQQLAKRNLLHCNIPLSKIFHAVVQPQVATRVSAHFSAQVLEVVRFALVGDLRIVTVELIQQTLQRVTITRPNRFPYSVNDHRVRTRAGPRPRRGPRSKAFSLITPTHLVSSRTLVIAGAVTVVLSTSNVQLLLGQLYWSSSVNSLVRR